MNQLFPQPRSTYLMAAGYEMHVTEWGNRANPAVVLWHGLARTGRDFDELAASLSEAYFVLCPDTLGRGLSQWSGDEGADYSFPHYAAMALDMLAFYKIEKMRWVGTSMGGLLGMTLAATSLKDRMTHLLINDVGPDLPAASARRIANYVGNPPDFSNMADFESWLREIYAPFGQNSDAFWRRMADTSVRRRDDGRLTVHYDPEIVSLVAADAPDIDIWDLYDLVTAKTKIVRGEHSDVLTSDTANKMTARGPRADLEVIADCGHAPTLASQMQIEMVTRFLSD